MDLIKPKYKDEALLQNIHNAGFETGAFHLWWLGQSGFLIQWQQKHLLIDPYLSDSLTKKYADTEKPHIRMTEKVIVPERLDFIDIVTSSHNHTDHLDAETLKTLLDVNPKIKMIIPEANRRFVVNRLGCDSEFPIGLDDGETVNLGDFSFTGVPAAHESIEFDDAGRCRFMGYIVKFGPWVVYHSGDTMWYPGIEENLKPHAVDVAILPINGKDPERKVAGNLNAEEAVKLGKLINAKLVIPCHYDMFTFNTADPERFIDAAHEYMQPYQVLQCGERWSSNQLL